MFINDDPNQSPRQRRVKGYSQVQSLGHPMQPQMQGHPMQPQMQGHPQEYPNHPNYAAMEDEPEYDNYDPDFSDDELYDVNATPKSTSDKIKDFFKSTAGIITLVVILAIIVALMVWYFSSTKGYKFLYY